MICEIKYEGMQYRFRVALVSNPKRYETKDQFKMDYELICISEEFPDKLKRKVFDHFEFKKFWSEGKINLII